MDSSISSVESYASPGIPPHVQIVNRNNHFKLIRVLAAIGVLCSHSFAVTGQAEPTFGGITIGYFSVCVFFSISGFLITKSWLRLQNVRSYVCNRFLRIFPGLWGAVLFTALFIGPAATTFTLSKYFHSPSLYVYLAGNCSLLRVVHRLPGLFEDLANKSANGSLWTLPYEILCYGIIAVLGVFAKKSKNRFLGLLAGTFLCSILAVFLEIRSANHQVNHFLFTLSVSIKLFGPFFPYFLSGALVCMLPTICTRYTGAIILAVAMLFVTGWRGMSTLVFPFLLPYALIGVSHFPNPLLARYNRFGDYSYGIYLYAFPIQQIIALSIKECTPAINFLLAFPVVIALAIISWHLIEARAVTTVLNQKSGHQNSVSRTVEAV